ncbi:DUF6479 family protein [Streptomyces sp. NPDC051219]|uniref:DUF6479 family protein n=1 Tax=Streptomyces sp. NPDC051219 TaxID=3155283 RepID=UPI00342FD922
MNTPNRLQDTAPDVVLAARDHLIGIAPFVVGLAMVAFLLGAFWWGKKRRAQEPPVPRPEDQPERPDHRTHIEESGHHSTAAFPAGGDRLMPYQLKGHGNDVAHPGGEEPRGDTSGGRG